MRLRVTVGPVDVRVDGCDYTRAQVRALLMDCAGIAATLAPDAEPSSPIGFTAHVERLPDDLPENFHDDEE